jgi:hypothetical protein
LKWVHALKVAWLIEVGAHAQSERFGDFFSSFLLQLKVDEKQIRSR